MRNIIILLLLLFFIDNSFAEIVAGGKEYNVTTNNISRLYIDTNGLVGIGVLLPTSKLDINGQIKIRGGFPSSAKYLASDANGLAIWDTLKLGSNYLSGDGDNEGLIIDSSGNSTFSNLLTLNGQIKILGGSFGLNKVLTSDANGLATWENAQVDNLGDHSSTQNLKLNSFYLSGDGGNEGLSIDSSGDSTFSNLLTLNDKIQIKGGSPSSGKVLTSDANGLATWEIASGTDDLGNHTAEQNIILGNYFLSKDGNDTGLSIDGNSVVTFTNRVWIKGGLPFDGAVLTSDANGFASWEVGGSGGSNPNYEYDSEWLLKTAINNLPSTGWHRINLPAGFISYPAGVNVILKSATEIRPASIADRVILDESGGVYRISVNVNDLIPTEEFRIYASVSARPVGTMGLDNPIFEDATIKEGFFQNFGDKDTNGSFRLGVVSGDFVLQNRAAGVWQTIHNFGSY